MPRQFWIKIINNFILNCRQIFVLIIKNEIILFENQGVKLEVNLKDETVWLTQKQMAELFGKDRRTITRHIQNIYKDEELSESSVCSFFEHTAEDGKKYDEKLEGNDAKEIRKKRMKII